MRWDSGGRGSFRSPALLPWSSHAGARYASPLDPHRSVIVHFAVSTRDQVARIQRLGAIVSGNPYYPVALADNYRSNGLDPERADVMVRMGDVERAGISYSFHSDMPMAPGQPLFLMWCGVNRLTNDGNLRGPEQRVSRLGALKAVTLDAAYSLRMENEVGSLQPGKLANITVLDGNPVTCDPAKIKDLQVRGTVHEGHVLRVVASAAGKAKTALGPRHDASSFAALQIAVRESREAHGVAHRHGAVRSCGVARELSDAITVRLEGHGALARPSSTEK